MKLHLITNKNHIVDTNVASYRRRKAPDRGLVAVVPVILVGEEQSGGSGVGIKLNIPLEVIILVVAMTHEAGEKTLVTARNIIDSAKQALAREFPGKAYEELDREELLTLLQVQGMQALNTQIESLDSQVKSLTGEIGELKRLLERLLGNVTPRA